MMKTLPLKDLRQLDCAEEQNLTDRLERFAMALLCIGLVSTALTAMTALSAFAAQPGAAPPATSARPASSMPYTLAMASPGTLTAMKAPASIEMNNTLTFNFMGTGHCKISLNSGDGSVVEVQGELPFTATHFYSSGTMTSYEAFKNYTASATPSGNCKISGAGPFTTVVQVVNPHPQSVSGTPAGNNTIGVAGSGKLELAPKPR